MDYAIIALKGHQYLIREGEELIIDRLDKEEGSKINLNNVLLAKNKEVMIGTPELENIKIKAEVLKHFKGDKITVIKFKPKKRYRRKKGFRPHLTKLKIEKITNGKN